MTEQHELSHAESLVEVDSQVLNDIDQGPSVDGRQQELEERNAFRGEAVVRLMVTLSLNLARVLLHTPADTILTRAAENPILPESVRESAASLASQESVDFAAIAQRIIAASTDMLKPKDVSTPELEMTSEAFSALLRLATQFMGHINGLDAEQVYESSKSYMVLQRSAPTQNQRRVSLTRMVRNRIMPQQMPIDAFRRYTRFAMAAYGALGMKYLGVLPRANTSLWNNNQAIQYLTGVDPERSLLGAEWRAKWSGSVYRPGWFVALDHNHKEVVVAIRGSFRFQDSLTDLMCEDAPFSFHYDKTQDLENAQREIQEVINSVEGALFGLNSNLDDMTIGELESDVIDTTQNLFSNLKGFLHRQSVLVREEMDIVLEEERYLDSDDSEQGFDSEEENAREERQSLLQWVKQMNSSSAAFSGAEGRRKPSLPRPKMLSGRESRDEQAPKGFRKVKGRAHFGFLKAARALAIELEQVVLRGLEAHPTYKVVLVGHSLGSAVATLITLLWSKHTKLKSARCYGLAPPACLSKEIAESPIACSKVTSLVLEDDLVPRLSLGSVSDLRDSIRFVSTRKVSSDAHGRTVCEFVKSVVSQDLPEQTKSAAFTPVMNKIRATSHAHKKLYPAGTIYHLENGKADLSLARKKKPTDFGEIILSSSMFLSHVPDSYVYSICGSLPLPQAEPQMDPSPTMVG